MRTKTAEWIVVEYRGDVFGWRAMAHPTVDLEHAQELASRQGQRLVKRVTFKMGGCKDEYGYYLAIGTADGEFYKVREV